MGKYKYCETIYDCEDFSDMAAIVAKYWGNGGGCLAVEEAIKAIKGKTKEEWEENAREAGNYLPCTGYCNKAGDTVFEDVCQVIVGEVEVLTEGSEG